MENQCTLSGKRKVLAGLLDSASVSIAEACILASCKTFSPKLKVCAICKTTAPRQALSHECYAKNSEGAADTCPIVWSGITTSFTACRKRKKSVPRQQGELLGILQPHVSATAVKRPSKQRQVLPANRSKEAQARKALNVTTDTGTRDKHSFERTHRTQRQDLRRLALQ